MECNCNDWADTRRKDNIDIRKEKDYEYKEGVMGNID